MNLEEHAAKPLLAKAGIEVPIGRLVATPEEAAEAAREIGACVIKAQVPTGKRGKAGGIRLAGTPEEAAGHASTILGMEIGGYRVETLLVEAQVPIARELYAALICDPSTLGPILLFSTLGGMDVEEAAEQDPHAMRSVPIDIDQGLSAEVAAAILADIELDGMNETVAAVLARLYQVFRNNDAELLEINPLVLTEDRRVVALDCKFTLDESSAHRQEAVAALATEERHTDLEAEAHAAGLRYIELGGSVGVLANGAGVTMTTMDAVTHFGGRPANFLEVGGEAYTKSRTALEILLKNPNIKSLLVNFCGAFARTDVMAEGVVTAWKALDPDIPIFFSIHGTGEDEAIALVKRELGIEPFDLMDDAVKAAVVAAGEVRA